MENFDFSDIPNYKSHYSERGLWKKITNVAKLAGAKVVYSAILLYYVLQDPNVPKADKAKILGALGYFILPLDIVPDFIPGVGYADDLTILMWAVHSVYVNITPEMKERARCNMQQWFFYD